MATNYQTSVKSEEEKIDSLNTNEIKESNRLRKLFVKREVSI